MKWAVVLKGLGLQGPGGQGVGLQGPRGLRVGPRERVPGGQGVGLQGPRGPIYKWSDFSCGRFNKLTNEHRYSMRPSRTKRFRPTRSMYCNLFIPFINSRDFHGHDHFTSMLFPRQASNHPTAAMNCPMINFGLNLLRYLVAEFGLSVSQWVHPVCGPI